MQRFVSLRGALAVGLLIPALAACGGSNEGGNQDGADGTVDGIPQQWLTATADGWEGSKGQANGVLTVDHDSDCLVLPDGATLEGQPLTPDGAGWGPEGDAGYRYQCETETDDHIATSLSLIRLDDAAAVDEYVAGFLATGDSSVQDNTTETLTARGAEVHVLVTEYITNPKAGSDYTAVFADPESSALVELEVSSLDDDERERYSTQNVADDLAGVIAAGG
ncbi:MULTISPECIES: hypothetical protein [Prauserella salsuginis group]|uniref:Uncharacterized protein n=1 Tax=Prauserella salsuginis TaxID=387889 RepID=A0ABW6G8J9_9PSEU|nr:MULTISPECIES: hypothetical protein [Prauserella salsuginis group]